MTDEERKEAISDAEYNIQDLRMRLLQLERDRACLVGGGMRISDLELPVRARHALYRSYIRNTDDIRQMLERGDCALLSIRNFGQQSLDALMTALKEHGYDFKTIS